ncbi:hypothetical protein O0I10_004445 [Lichtheimia ornata]|uniref:Uncharacterized protein n=1 Tax=Lichtheimia ornata TaxID=688661 RepID=A0AAD7V8H0_9FUNG|nr:uncharacterized protein O0I10_004445 [Lichtheimia ornata]KAJ8659852.1 hypothetical protein O0I10_004445 [Lichtheimia ornata]
MSALEGDAVINPSSSVDLFKPSKQVTSTRSPPKLLRGMAMHKAMQHVYGLPSPSSTTTTAATTTSSSSPSIDELCEALNMLDLYDQDTEVPDAIPDTPELREIAEDEGTDASEQQVQELADIPMASPLPSPPFFPLPLPPPPPSPLPQQQPILYTQVMPQPTITIHPEATPEVVVAAVVAAASSAPAASAIPVASSTGSSNNNNRSRLQFRRPVIRPRSRLRWQRPSRRQPPPLPRPPPSPPRPPPSPSISPPPSSPPSPASSSSSSSWGYEYRPIACPRRRLQRPETTTTTTTSSPIPSPSSPIPSLSSLSPILPMESSLSPILPLASSSSTLLFTEAELAPPSPILSEDAAQADSFMGGDDILAEIMGTDLIDPFDEVVFDEDA